VYHAAIPFVLIFIGQADAPVARLSGPKTAEVGAMILLNPAGSVAPGGLEYGLAAGPAPAPVLKLTDENKTVSYGMTSATTAGVYVFYVVAWGVAVQQTPPPTPPPPPTTPPHAFAFWTVVVGTVPPTPGPGPGPGPSPGPNPPNPGTLGLVKVSYDASRPVAVRATEGPKLAGAAKSVVSMIGAGVFNNQANDPAALAAAVLQSRRAANKNAGVTETAWAPWAAAVDAALKSLYDGGKIKTKDDWMEAMNEIALGLGG
jgi:hypothetical protein